MVELKVQAQTEFSLPDGKRKTRTKEVVSELIKREMGLHTDEGQRKRGFLDVTWTARCDKLMAEDSRLLLEFDKLKAGVKLQSWPNVVERKVRFHFFTLNLNNNAPLPPLNYFLL